MLLWTIYVLAGAIGLMLLGVFLREAWRARERSRFGHLRTECTEQLLTLKTLAGCGKSRVMDDSIASRKFLS